MWKKSVLGLAILVAGLLVWSCGDGSVDSLSDNEVMMISRFPSTIDYEMLDSIVNACKKDKECWEKAQKTGEIYKGDYTTILRDSSGNIIYKEGDSTFIYDKEGRKLPVLVLSSSSNSDGEEDVTSSGSNTTSGSSSRRSSASGAGYDDDDFVDDYGGGSNGSGSGTSSRQYASTSSSSKKTGSSSSIDMSVLNASSSSVKVASSGNIVIDLGSSSSKIVITQSSVSRSSSSATVVVLSSSSRAQHGGGGSGGGNTGTTCTVDQLKGSCKPTKDEVFKGKPVTYKFTPTSANSCNATDNIQWSVLPGLDGTTGGASPTDQVGGYTFDVTYSLAGEKKSVMFTMGGVNVPCDAVTIRPNCSSPNSYTCTVKLNSASNNLTKNNPVSYTWTLTKGGCYDVTSVSWSGAVSGSNVYTVTKGFSSASTYSESISVVDESSTTPKSVSCPSATVRNVTETKPSFNVSSLVTGTELSVAVTPTSIAGCDYDASKCSYSIKKKSTGAVLASGSSYSSGALSSFTGESTDSTTVTYTLTLTNYLGGGGTSKDFNVTYYEIIPITATATFVKYIAGRTYNVSVGTISNGNDKFKCNVNSTSNVSRVVGTFDGTTLTIDPYQSRTNTVTVTSNSSHVFIVNSDRPSDMTCGLLNW